ncbi:uncharacterized protein JCM6883_002284 [Sporobolomyces salmoneus]|uniref:uncharacterized protein n=1 Tax=Sporobolomyces salmoneus TaxID=183962 RepID=UPI003172B39F
MSNLVPRVYQDEAAREALKANKIIRADTGTGKTLIAILLLKQITSLSGKFAVFISPNVTLVYQQTEAIREATNLRVQSFVGSDGVDYWKREEWVKQIENCDVGVMTPQVFLNLCDNAYWTFDKISLIIFDECHNCSKNHPCAVVMRNHYHPLKARDPSLLPRILGLTASPIYNVKRPEKTISELESVLDGRILEVTSAASVSRKAQEQLIEHAPLGPEPQLAPSDQALLISLAETGKLDYRAATRAPACQSLFGQFGLDLYLSLIAEECGASPETVEELKARTATLDVSTLSSKLAILIRCLEGFRNQPHFHAIVFVQQRHHAKILSHILSLVPSLRDWIRPGFLTGHGGGRGKNEEGDVSKEVGMEIKEQQETVKKFRDEELNLLVATRVAEEGLDFQACNVVVRFDSLETITGYIQSRGRARAADALFVVIAEQGSEEAARYKKYVTQEVELKSLYSDRPEEQLEELELDNLPTYSTSTGALLTFRNAIPLLATFCSRLNRTDQFTPTQKPIYRHLESAERFTYELTLPKIAALEETTFVSDVFPTKKAARQSTAFNCCVRLHKAGVIDDYLLPVRDSLSTGAKDALGREVDQSSMAKQVPVSTLNPFGNIWTAERAFVHVLEMQDDQTTLRLGLLCATRQASLDEGAIYGTEGNLVRVKLLRVDEMRWKTTEERDEQLRRLEEFNRLCTRIQLNRNLGDEDKFYALWFPLSDSNDFDLSLVDQAFSTIDASTLAPESLIVVPTRRPHSRLGQLSKIRDDVNTASITADILTDPPKSKRSVIARYPLYPQYLKVLYDHDFPEDCQPEAIIEFEPLKFSPYFLGPNAEKLRPVGHEERRVFPISMCRLSNLSLDFWSAWTMVPALNRLLGTRTIANVAIDRLKLPAIKIDQLMQALTTPLSCTGIDYEYLETLGDSFLKLATSIHVYLEYPASEEGRLTILRMNSVDNRFLRQQCVKTGLDSFIQSFPLRWVTFVPENVDSLEVSPDGTTFSRQLGRKVLSDVVEATLGAAVLSGDLPIALETGDKLGLCFGGGTLWGDRPAAKKLLDIEEATTAPALRFLEEAFGYKIKTQGRLLVQALTHRSFPGDGYCYEREEYLGDAILDWWATSRLFPLSVSTTPRFLTFRRAMLVSNPTLALLAIRKLRVHKSILHNSPLLEKALRDSVDHANEIDWEDVLAGDMIWVWSPPKVLGDVFEALLAVIFIDSGFDLDVAFAALDKVNEDILPFLGGENERRDPHSRMLMWRDVHACSDLKVTLVRNEATSAISNPFYTSTVTFHSKQIAHQVANSKSVARQMAAIEALASLDGEVAKSCDCKERKVEEKRERLEKLAAGDNSVEGVELGQEIGEAVEREVMESDAKTDEDEEENVDGDEEDGVLGETEREEARLPLRVRDY